MQKLTIFWNSLNKFYFCNLALFFTFIFVIFLNFVVQFKVENLQDKIEENRFEMSSYKEQINLLEVQWAYLTRPSRIRELSAKYLKDTTYSLASQIKSESQVENFYIANFEDKEIVNF